MWTGLVFYLPLFTGQGIHIEYLCVFFGADWFEQQGGDGCLK